ncbi:hypothetical protein [Neolewinella antarctica]|uniref:Uncharacterized protein n=1 Tax=Neolewinella antarctica TaxID=442734 RepID=A0ABX0X7Q1_9BACT|nr:hypothetical protein [Neolewinella antarctica]NJC25009.1 hypothetical protein [Neolewinella antarctica]
MEVIVVSLYLVVFLGIWSAVASVAALLLHWFLDFKKLSPGFRPLAVLCFVLTPALIWLLSLFSTKMIVTKGDIYGNYVIDRSLIPGPAADWQYAKYTFRIFRNNELVFTEWKNDGHHKSCKMPITIIKSHPNHHLKISPNSACHHVVAESPTMYRGIWNFTYVFKSHHYGNMFFRKVRWWEFWLR